MALQAEIRALGNILGVAAELDVRVLGGPVSIRLASVHGINFIEVWNAISEQLQRALGFGLPSLNGPWAKLIGISVKPPLIITPALWIGPSGSDQSKLALSLQLEFSNPIDIGGPWYIGPVKIEMDPPFKVLGLVFSYDKAAGGLDIKAKVSTPTTSTPSSASQGRLLAASPAGEKVQMVSFPFPVPAQQSLPLFTFHYLGIGQRVGPDPNVTSDDPMLAIFEQLETQLVGDDPAQVLTTIANTFYHPDRDWFIGLDVELRGFRVMVLFNDPAMYGLRISVAMSPPTPFSGFLFEILYQKLGPNLGVYYGALTLPYFMRRIVLEGVILILPGFAIWIYTNGDFRVNVGWPLGDASIAVQVGVLVGAAGFYFARLRSGDNPAVQPSVDYNPILAFGIGVTLYVKESFNASVFSATLSVSLTATLQGLLAWKEGSSTSSPPSHYWFAGTASLSVLIEGMVDFSIIKASVTISFNAFAGVAFETGYATLITVSAAVSVRVSVKIVFFTVHLSFSAHIARTFTIGSGTPASVNGPLDPDLSGFVHPTLSELLAAEARERVATVIERLAARPVSAALPRGAAAQAGASPEVIDVMFALQPTAVYDPGGPGAFSVVAGLFIQSPHGGSPPTLSSPFERLIVAVVDWLLSLTPTGGRLSQRFQQIVDLLGAGSDSPMGDWRTWRTVLDDFLSTRTFVISEIDAGSPDELPGALLPMLDVLRLSYTDAGGQQKDIDFDTFDPVPPNYPTILNEYYRDVGWTGVDATSGADVLTAVASLRRSFAAFVLADYFLMQSRSAASSLLQLALAYEAGAEEGFLAEALPMVADARRSWDLVDLTTAHVADVTGDTELGAILRQFDYASAAGMGSRYLLNGLQLPVPDTSPIVTAPLNVLTGQQFAVAPRAAAAFAVLSISPTSGAPPESIIFASGSPGSASCTLPLPQVVPPEPTPDWTGAAGSPAEPVNGTITVSPLPGLTAGPLYYATRNQIAWNADGEPRTMFPLPQALLSLIAAGAAVGSPPLRLSISPAPPPSSNVAALSSPTPPPLPSTAGLLIRLTINQVPANRSANVAAGGSPASGSPPPGVPTAYLPFVYQVGGADEATRDLIFAALKNPVSDATISLLYPVSDQASPGGAAGSPASATGLRSDALADNVLLAKTNLSTLNQVPATGAVHADRFAFARDLGGDAASIRDVPGFLRLLWEVSVVNAPGFFLFYDTVAGEDLPASLFTDPGGSAGNTAQFDVLVRFSSPPEPVVTLPPAANCVFLEQPGPSQAVYLEVLTASGAPAVQYAPTYPAGSIGFSLLWSRPPESRLPVPVTDLYHLIQYRVLAGGGYRESVWSLPVGPTENNGPQAALASPTDWTYVQSVPVHRFLGSPAANRYAVVDRPVDIAFRVVDLYGDALPQEVTASFRPLYQDPLLTVGQWPGVVWSWRIVAGSSVAAALRLEVTFDPDSVVPPSSPGSADATARGQWLALLARYQLILDQLTDPNTAVSIISTLTNGPITDGPDITRRLTDVAGQIARHIEEGLAASPPAVDGLQGRIELEVPFTAVAGLPDDVVPVRFTIGASRPPKLVDPLALDKMPSAAAAAFAIPADVAASAGAEGSPSTRFAVDFESAFQGFDSGGGALKLAQRAGVQDGQDAPTVESWWAVRWSAAAGIAVDFDPSPVFFALAPLGRTPLSGTFAGVTWSEVDLDAWARQFVAAVDAFLSPQLATAIAVLDLANSTHFYADLTNTKQALAATIVKGVAPLFENQAAGDLAGARARLEQALLTTLASAFTVSTVVQVAGAVTLGGPGSPGASPARAPRLYGSVGPNTSSSPVDARQYTLSSGELELLPGLNWMTTLLTVTNPERAGAISMPLDYQVSYLQHDFQIEERFLDYVPSSWLKFALPAAPPLQMPIAADAILAVPLIFAPQSPSLDGQQALAAPMGSGDTPAGIVQEIEDALRWDYRVQVTPNWSAQDTLYFDVTYNLTPTEVAAARTLGRAASPELSLAEALAQFLLWYQSHAAAFGVIVSEAFPGGSPPSSPAVARELVEAFSTLASAVQVAWDGLFEPPVEALAAPEVTVDSFAAETSPSAPSQMVLSGHAADWTNPTFWPTVNGVAYESRTAQRTSDGWWVQPQPFQRTATVDMVVPDLQIGERQSAMTAAWIVRNANLVQDMRTNEDFIYQTDPVSFRSCVVPLIHRASLSPLPPSASLTATLADVLAPIASSGAGLATSLRLAAAFSFAIAAMGDSLLPTAEAILLADEVQLGGSPDDVTRIASEVARGIRAWHLAAPRPTRGATLNLAVTLFGTLGSQQLPLVQIDRIPIDVSGQGPSWWTS